MPTRPVLLHELVPVAATGCAEPDIAADGETVHAVWSGDGTLYHSYRAASGWTALQSVAGGSKPALACSPDGRVHCLYQNQFGGNWEIFHTTWDGSKWSLPRIVSHTSGESTQPAVAVSASGLVHAVWCDRTPGVPAIYHGEMGPDSWTSIPAGDAKGWHPTLALSADNRLALAWQERKAADGSFLVRACCERPGDWQTTSTISDGRPQHAVTPRIAADTGGGYHLVWQQEQGERFHIRYAHYSGGQWSNPSPLTELDQDSSFPHLVASPQGQLHLAWFQGKVLRHRQARVARTVTWEDSETLLPAGGEPTALAIACSRSGTLHFAWVTHTPHGYALHYGLRDVRGTPNI